MSSVEMTEMIGAATHTVAENISAASATVAEKVGATSTTMWEKIGAVSATTWEKVGTASGTIWEKMGAAGEKFKGGMTTLKDSVTEATGKVKDAAAGKLEGARASIGPSLIRLGDKFSDLDLIDGLNIFGAAGYAAYLVVVVCLYLDDSQSYVDSVGSHTWIVAYLAFSGAAALFHIFFGPRFRNVLLWCGERKRVIVFIFGLPQVLHLAIIGIGELSVKILCSLSGLFIFCDTVYGPYKLLFLHYLQVWAVYGYLRKSFDKGDSYIFWQATALIFLASLAFGARFCRHMCTDEVEGNAADVQMPEAVTRFEELAQEALAKAWGML